MHLLRLPKVQLHSSSDRLAVFLETIATERFQHCPEMLRLPEKRLYTQLNIRLQEGSS